MCPQGAGGRPAVAPLILRTIGWTDNAAEVTAPVERGSTPRFEVFGVDGKLAGAFDTMGVVDVGLPQQVAMGAYAGASPCTYGAMAIARPKPGEITTRAEDPKCGAATQSCGIAVAEVSHPDEPPTTSAYVTGGACVSGDQLAVDIDGDGRIESFPLVGVLDGARAPAAEWSASPTATAACEPKFQLYDIKLKGEDPKLVDPKSRSTCSAWSTSTAMAGASSCWRCKFATVRTIVVYTATSQPQRLELAGEATSLSQVSQRRSRRRAHLHVQVGAGRASPSLGMAIALPCWMRALFCVLVGRSVRDRGGREPHVLAPADRRGVASYEVVLASTDVVAMIPDQRVSPLGVTGETVTYYLQRAAASFGAIADDRRLSRVDRADANVAETVVHPVRPVLRRATTTDRRRRVSPERRRPVADRS